MNRLGAQIVLLLILGSVFVTPQDALDSTNDAVTILSVSQTLGIKNQHVVGSREGGQKLYLQVQGLDSSASNNKVFIGPYPCLIADNGVNFLDMVCVTTKPTDPDQLNSLPITVQVEGKSKSTCSAGGGCYYDYSLDETPRIYYVTPRSNYAGAFSTWRGRFLEGNTRPVNIQEMKIGSYSCDRFNIRDDGDDDSDIYYWDALIQCQVAKSIEAGTYNLKMRTSNGYASLGQEQKNIYNDLTYTHKILPQITALSSNIVSPAGQFLTIMGSGFTDDPTKIIVKCGNVEAKVSSSSTQKIEAIVPPLQESDQPYYISGAGLYYRRFDLLKLQNVGGNCDQLRISVLAKEENLMKAIVEEGVYPEPDTQDNFGDYYGQFMEGYFKAPKTGNYKFYIASDDCSQLWINTTPGSQDTASMIKAVQCSWSPEQRYWYRQTVDPQSVKPDANGNEQIQQISQPFQLQKDEFYFIQIVHMEGQGQSYLKVSVEIENEEGYKSNSIEEIQVIKTSYNNVKEVIEINVYNSEANTLLEGTYTLSFFQKTGKTVLYDRTTNNINPKFSAIDMQNFLSWYCGYTTTVIRSNLRKDGQLLSDEVIDVAGYRYTVTFERWRQLSIVPTIKTQLTKGTLVQKIVVLQEPTPPISGTYSISFGGYEVEVWDSVNSKMTNQIPYNFDAQGIAYRIYDKFGFQPLYWASGTFEDGSNLFFYMLGGDKSQDMPKLKITANNLAGGLEKPTIEVITVQERSKNLLFEPIPSELLFTFSNSSPQVTVEVNNVLGSCQAGICDYKIDRLATPVMTDFHREGSKVTLTLTEPEGTSLTIGDLFIEHAGHKCKVQKVEEGVVECLLPEQEGQPIVEAGDNIPFVNVDRIGVPINTAEGFDTVLLTITSVTPSEGSLNGGTVLTIEGSGFPESKSSSGLILTVGGQDMEIISSNNNQITAITPAHTEGEVNINMEYNGKTATSIFTYSLDFTVVVTSLDKDSFSPIAKGDIVITGQNFGTNKDDLALQLVEQNPVENVPPRIIDLNVISVTDGTSITGFLGGGRTGQYTLRVYRKGWGYSQPSSPTASDFSYRITVQEISPISGSLNGGTLITITGTNFKNDETQVFFGDAINWFCNIQTVTSTEITCLTPLKHDDFQDNQEITVHVFGRLTEKAICTGTCSFTYSSAQTPTVNEPDDLIDYSVSGDRRLLQEGQQYERHFNVSRNLWGDQSKIKGNHHFIHHFNPRRNLQASTEYAVQKVKVYISGQTEVIAGSGFTETTEIHIGFDTNSNAIASVVSSFTVRTSTQLEFDFPSLPQGLYKVAVYVPQKGYGDFIWYARVSLTVTSITPSYGSRGGAKIQLLGGGFNLSPPPQIQFYEGTANRGNCIELNIVDSEHITCQIPRLPNQNTVEIRVAQINPENLNLETVTNAWYSNTVNQVVDRLSADSLSLTVTEEGKYFATYTQDSDQLSFIALGNNLAGENIKVSLRTQEEKLSYQGTILEATATTITFSFTGVPAGIYIIDFLYDDVNFAYWNQIQRSIVQITFYDLSSSIIQSSYAGGAKLTLSGKGLDLTGENTQIKVCGFPCPVVSSSFTEVQCEVPPVLTSNTKSNYNFAQMPILLDNTMYTLTGGRLDQLRFVNDGMTATNYFEHADGCFIQYNFEDNLKLELRMLRYIKPSYWGADMFIGSKFQYSTDGTNFEDLVVLDNMVHDGWNFYVPETPIQGIQALKYTDPQGTKSECRIAEIEIKGWLLSAQNPELSAGIDCDVQVNVNGNQSPLLAGKVQYRQPLTPIVTGVEPKFGSTGGQTQVTITGTDFSTDKTQVSVIIDQIVCEVSSSTLTQIQCVTAFKDVATNQNSGLFEVKVNEQRAVNEEIFQYGDLYSDIDTWGGDIPPREGDVIYIPKGQILIIDQDTPIIGSILVEGGLTFADDKDLNVNAKYIVIREGKFWIGQEGSPHQNKLTVTLYGHLLDIQLPSMGNKVIGCHMCELDIHGKKPSHYYSLLSQTAEIGATTIDIEDVTDWKVGDEIVIASSHWDHTQSERRFITIIDGNSISFAEPLVNRHYSAVETFGEETFPMQVEVALLTRNVVIQGDPTDSMQKQYGAHLMIHGKANMGAIGRIENAEFRYSGQPKILGRYPIHFHLNSEVYDSYVKGNSIHDSNARCITIHGVSYLRVLNNVGYNANGHNIFLEDGIETNNIIQHNLMIGAKQSWIMLQTDITVATYWITNPNNIVTDNRSGGSEWYGFWYEIKEHPDGPSATSDICPPGLKLGQFKNNVAHSNGRFGLRILEMAPREEPCKASWNQAAVDPFVDNPSYEAIFENFITWKNNEDGVLGEILGDITFRNFKIADSKLAGFQAHKTNLTSRGAVIENFLIVGKSKGNPLPDDYYIGSHGIIVPRTDGFLASNIRLWNFDANMILLQSCSFCWNMKLSVTGGKNTKFQNIAFFNSDDAQVIFWEKHRREIFWDLDGSITGPTLGKSGQAAYIIPYKAHLDGVPGCTRHSEAKWDDSIICVSSPDLQVRDILINNPVPGYKFNGVDQRIFRLGTQETELIDLSEELGTKFTNETMNIIKKSNDVPLSFASPFITNQIYNIHWKEGIDFDHVGIYPSQYFTPDDKGIILRFNYTNYRETFDVSKNIGGQLKSQYTKIETEPDPNSCDHGSFYNDLDNKFLYLCLSGKGGKDRFEYVDINSVICRENCDSIGTQEVDKFFTPWSSPNAWESGTVPLDGESATLKAGRKVLFDVDQSVLLEDLVILGELHFDNERPQSLLQAHNIFVRSGKIIAGSPDKQFTSNINIVLHGSFGGRSLIIDPFVDASNKVLAVTGGIELFGNPPTTTWTRLAEYAVAGDQFIKVLELEDWKVGDLIVIGPSGRDPEEQEQHTISKISANTITLTKPLQFDHYGDPQITIDEENIGKLDMRAAVGHLTRNIKISGNAQSSWGCRVLIYQFVEPGETLPRRGYGRFNGVEWENCGQYDTSNAALDLISLNSETIRKPSFVTNSAFHNSLGMFIHANDVYDFKVQNNVLYNGVRAHMQLNLGRNIIIEDNLMIYLKKRQVSDGGLANWAVFIDFVDDVVEVPSSINSDNISVQKNVGQGSQDTGFHFMATQCSQANKISFKDNECSSVILACFVYRQVDDECGLISGANAFHAKRGLMATFNGPVTKITNLVLAENEISLVVKPGLHNQYDNSIYANNLFITALARKDCSKCYQGLNIKECSQQIGFQLGSISSASFPPHTSKPSDAADTICTVQMIDGRVYLDQVTFSNFRQSYDENKCNNNAVFRQHRGAVDMNCAHFLTNTVCKDCEEKSLFSFRDADPSLIGWFGGCGSFECTGQINALIEDQDGKFFGDKFQAISNNKYFAPNATDICTKVEAWNGYKCQGNQISELKWMSIAPDFNKRLFSPVSLGDGDWFNYVNSLKEWQWDGPEPLNLRESKFIALIKVNTVINMTYAGMEPSDAHFWLTKRLPNEKGGSPKDWVIIKLQYFEPLSILVSNDFNGQNNVIKPFIQSQRDHADLTLYKTECGANNYYRENNTIHFVVTGAPNCLVRVKKANSVFITSRLSVTYDQFWANGNKNSGDWFAMTVALMGESSNNIKIVGHRPSSGRRMLVGETEGMEIEWETSDPQPIGGEGYDPKAVKARLEQKSQDAEIAAKSPRWSQELNYDVSYEGSQLAVVENPVYQSTEKTTDVAKVVVNSASSQNTQSESTSSVLRHVLLIGLLFLTMID